MCETEMLHPSEDGLCAMCHMELCLLLPHECPRCSEILEKLLKFLDGEDS